MDKAVKQPPYFYDIIHLYTLAQLERHEWILVSSQMKKMHWFSFLQSLFKDVDTGGAPWHTEVNPAVPWTGEGPLCWPEHHISTTVTSVTAASEPEHCWRGSKDDVTVVVFSLRLSSAIKDKYSHQMCENADAEHVQCGLFVQKSFGMRNQ